MAKQFNIKLNLNNDDALAAAGAMNDALGGIVGIASTVVRSFVETNNEILRSSKMVTDYRATLLELAALKGRLGDTTGELKDQILFRARTGQSAEAARAFQAEALNVGQISLDTPTRQGVMSPAEFAKAQVYGGMFQAANGGDPAALGQLVGNIPAFSGKGRMTGEENFRRLRQYESIMQLGGFTLSSGAAQAGKLAPYITSGMVGDLDAVSLMSMMSNSVPERGATGFEQLMRASVGGVGRMRGAKMMEGIDTQKTGEYLAGLGVTPGMKATDILRRISDDMGRQEGTEGFDPMQYLMSKGYGNQQERTALMTFHGRRKEFEEMYAPRAREENMPAFAAGMADIRKARMTDPVLRTQQAANAGDVANVVEDQGGTVANYQALNRATFEKMRAEGNWAVRGMKYEDLSGFNPWNILANAQVGKRMMDDVNEKLAAAGLPRYEGQPGLGDLNYAQRAKDFSILAENLRRRGVDIMPDAEEMAGVAAGKLDDFAAMTGLTPPAVAGPAGNQVMRRNEARRNEVPAALPSGMDPPPDWR